VGGLCAVAAARFVREPHLVDFTFPLWVRLNTIQQHFASLMHHIAAGNLRRPHGARSRRSPRNVSPPGAPTSRRRLPAGRAWLVRELGHEAMLYRAQVESLLAQPEVADVLAAAPAARQLLDPLCRMLGVSTAVLAATPDSPADAITRRRRLTGGTPQVSAAPLPAAPSPACHETRLRIARSVLPRACPRRRAAAPTPNGPPANSSCVMPRLVLIAFTSIRSGTWMR
jgi:hypothetical protein